MPTAVRPTSTVASCMDERFLHLPPFFMGTPLVLLYNRWLSGHGVVRV